MSIATNTTVQIIDQANDGPGTAAKGITYLPNGTPVGMTLTIHKSNPGRAWNSPELRVYVDVPNETILENIANRRNRPWTEWKKHVMPTVMEALPEMFAASYLQTTNGPWQMMRMHDSAIKPRWSQKAGCSMCPCSPGFIIPDVRPPYGYDASLWVHVGIDDTQDL